MLPNKLFLTWDHWYTNTVNKFCIIDRKNKVSKKDSIYSDFLFGSNNDNTDKWIFMAPPLYHSLTFKYSILFTKGLSLFCLPIIIPFSPPIDIVADDNSYITERHKFYAKSMLTVAFFQLSLGVCEFLLGDLVSGFITALVGAGGVYVTTPAGVKWIPSAVLMSFVNGCLQTLTAVEQLNRLSGIPLFSGNLPLIVNFSHLAMITSPIASFLMAYLAWNLLREIRMGVADFVSQSGGTRPAGPSQRLSTTTTTSWNPMATDDGSANFSPFVGSGYRLGENDIEGSNNRSPEITEDQNASDETPSMVD